MLRKYIPSDCTATRKLFYTTVHGVNIRDYTKAQVDVWAKTNVDLGCWNKSLLNSNTVIYEMNGMILGFGDIHSRGYLDRLYVHKDYQSQGIGTMIVNRLEHEEMKKGVTKFTTHASISSKKFFEKRGYTVLSSNIAVIDNIELTNFIMEKSV